MTQFFRETVKRFLSLATQPAFTCLKLTIETLEEEEAKYV